MNPLSIAEAAARHPQRLAVVCDQRAWTYAQLARQVGSVTELDSLFAPTALPTPKTLVALYAAVDRGIPVAPLAPELPASERNRLRKQLSGGPIPEHTLAILFTSGTTGEPKGAVLPRSAFLASARACFAHLDWRAGERWLCPLSLARIGGLAVVIRCLLGGGTAVLTTRVQGSDLRQAIDEGATLASLVPVQLERLLEDPSWTPPSHLRAVLVGGGPTRSALLELARDRGLPALTTYGSTETCAMVATAPLDRPTPPGSAGCILPGIAVDLDDHGSITVDGPTLMTGYFGEPPRSGPYSTGDRGHIDGEWLYVTGRIDDRIDSGGARIDPLTVEAELLSHPAIADACAFGLPDPTWGQIVAAIVVPAAAIGEAEMVAAVRSIASRLPGSHRPRRIIVAPEIPRSDAGKRSRQLLAKAAHGPWIPIRYGAQT
ncbi:MAG: AMP-binding protein [Deltaproteobacteria bacterium]|nr:AMP-binding protein [Deltaproteobacteria bacterium]